MTSSDPEPSTDGQPPIWETVPFTWSRALYLGAVKAGRVWFDPEAGLPREVTRRHGSRQVRFVGFAAEFGLTQQVGEPHPRFGYYRLRLTELGEQWLEHWKEEIN